MRQRFNTRAICSSDNYQQSKKAHIAMLNAKHSCFSLVAVSEGTNGEKSDKAIPFAPKYKIIKVFGKEVRVTLDEYNTHCKSYVQGI